MWPCVDLRFNTNHPARLPGAVTNEAYVKYKGTCTSITVAFGLDGPDDQRPVFDEKH
jgi:hypothetical protein